MFKRFEGKYDPMYFLASLGNGGLVVTFFMYLMFIVKHPKTPMPTFENVWNALFNTNIFTSVISAIGIIGIVYFAIQNLRFLIWNLKQLNSFKKTEQYKIIKTTNAEVSLMTIPLALAMTVNVLIISAVVFVPGIWNFVELMFPVAIFIFMIIGYYAIKIFSEYFSRIIVNGDFDFDKNNNLSQMIAVFAFVMIAAGFSGPAAMSKIKVVASFAMFMTLFFSSIAGFILLIKMTMGFKSILEKGISKEASPSFLIIIPILTITGIIFTRLNAGISHTLLHIEPSPIVNFVGLSAVLSVQIIVGFVGYLILKRTDYATTFLNGNKKSSGSYALICPGVALATLGWFFIHWGLVKTGFIPQFSPAYFIVLIPFIYVQLKTRLTMNRINKKHFA